MSERHPLRATFALLRGLFLVACVAIAAFAVVGYASGWIVFQHDEEKATIEIKTDEIQKSADDAIEKGEQFIDKAGDSLQPAEDETPAPTSEDAADVNDKDGRTRDNKNDVSPDKVHNDEAALP